MNLFYYLIVFKITFEYEKNRTVIKDTKINYEEEDSIFDFLNEYEYISFDGITYMI